MARTITVKGIGKVSAKPDYVVFSMTLESKHKDYDKAMDMAADHIQQLNETLCGIGFEKDSVKTTNFSVRTDYDRVKDRNGNYQSVFRGYEVTHNLKLAFDFDRCNGDQRGDASLRYRQCKEKSRDPMRSIRRYNG